MSGSILSSTVEYDYDASFAVYGGNDYASSLQGGEYGDGWGYAGESSDDAAARARDAYVSTPQGVQLISDIYANCLARAPSASELTTQKNAFINGASFDDMVYQLAHSAEATQKITALFTAIYQQAPTAAQILSRVNTLNGHGSLNAIARSDASFASSITKANFLAVIGRAPSSADILPYVAEVATGLSQTQVRLLIAQSAEANGIIANDFQTELNRPASAAELTAYQNALGSTQSAQQIRTTIATSPGSAAILLQTFEDELSRAPAAADYAYWESVIANGQSQQQVRTAIAGSTEAQASSPAISSRSICGRRRPTRWRPSRTICRPAGRRLRYSTP